MIQELFLKRKVLIKSATESDVHHLHAPAYGQDGDFLSSGLSCQSHLKKVSLLSQIQILGFLLFFVKTRIYVVPSAYQQSVSHAQHLIYQTQSFCIRQSQRHASGFFHRFVITSVQVIKGMSGWIVSFFIVIIHGTGYSDYWLRHQFLLFRETRRQNLT